jgi:hypothetical protein
MFGSSASGLGGHISFSTAKFIGFESYLTLFGRFHACTNPLVRAINVPNSIPDLSCIICITVATKLMLIDYYQNKK